MGRKVRLTSLPCPVCTHIFKPERKEQKFCSRLCGFKARSQRAIKNHLSKVEKRCCGCGEVKLMHCYSKNKSTMDGYQAICKSCRKNEDRERLIRVRMNQERMLVYKATYTRISRKCQAKKYALRSNASMDEWLHHMMYGRVQSINRKYTSQQEARDAYRYKKWLQYWENPKVRELRKDAARQAHKERPWVMLTRKHRRDARIQGALDDGSVSVEAMKELWATTQWCLYCGRQLTNYNKSVEHMHPMSKGGVHSIGNVVIVCASCNEIKRDKWFDEWVEVIDEPFRSAAHDRFVIQFSGSSRKTDYSG